MRLWFNETWRGTYQLIGLLRAGAADEDRPLHVIGSHRVASTPFLQACDEVLPEPAGAGSEFVEQALAICRRYAIDVYVPGREMLAVAEHAAAFDAAGVAVLVSPAAAVRTFATKIAGHAAAVERGIPVAATRAVTTLAEFRAAAADLLADGHEVCVKPDVDHGGRGFRIVTEGPDQLEALYEPPSVRVARETFELLLGQQPVFPRLVVQEYLAEPEISIDCVSDAGGRLVAAVPRGKSGLQWTRELLDAPAAVELARVVVARFGLRYLSNVQVRHRDGQPVLLEVNTRAASGLYQSAAAGVNLPWLAVKLLLGEPVPAVRPRAGAALIAYSEAMPFAQVPAAVVPAAVVPTAVVPTAAVHDPPAALPH